MIKLKITTDIRQVSVNHQPTTRVVLREIFFNGYADMTCDDCKYVNKCQPLW